MKVSFCITCKNRFHQISKTLLKNLKDNVSSNNDVEFILVDFDSKDGLKDWVLPNFKNELASGYLKYFFTKELPNWNCSIAKNTAHFLATGDILVNLDCDNFTGENGGMYVKRQFTIYGSKLVLHQSSSNAGDGSFGRISVLKKYFQLLGGYNEMFNPMGYQDIDLILRLVKFGLFYVPKCDLLYNGAIQNSKEEGLLYANSQKTYTEMSFENRMLSMENINFGNIIANNGVGGIKKNVFKYVEGDFLEVNR